MRIAQEDTPEACRKEVWDEILRKISTEEAQSNLLSSAYNIQGRGL
jgi:hypothetical protein